MYTNNYSNSVSTNSLYKVYSWMMVGLGITAITSALLYASGIFMLIIQIPMISLLLFIVQISLTISMGRQLSRNTPCFYDEDDVYCVFTYNGNQYDIIGLCI